MGTIILLDLLGGVALLLWGLHMVRSGIVWAFGADLRRFLSKAVNNRFSGFASGLLLTAILQSSTATGLMTASFAASGTLGAFMSGDANDAQELLAEKSALRSAELAAADSHLARLREGRPESIESSSLHLDVLRDLKRIHSHVCSVAYPILETAGALESGRAWRADAVRDSGGKSGAAPTRT